jgi:hypothetical protein
MTALETLCKYYDDNDIRYHRVVTGFYTGVSKMKNDEREGYVSYGGNLYKINDYRQLGNFIEFNQKGEVASISTTEQVVLCETLGISKSEKSLGIKLLPVKVFQKDEYVRTFDGVGIVLSTNLEYREQGRHQYLVQQYVTVQHKSGLSGNPSNLPKELEAYGIFPITRQEYNDDE